MASPNFAKEIAARDAAARQVAEAAAGLVDGFRRVIPRAVLEQVRRIVRAWGMLDPAASRLVEEAAVVAAERAGREIAEAWRNEAARPMDEQRRGPLQFLRSVRAYPTEVLAAAGVPPVARDPWSVDRFPDDVYGLVVERFLDLPAKGADELQELHIAWGVGKAMWVKAEQRLRAISGER